MGKGNRHRQGVFPQGRAREPRELRKKRLLPSQAHLPVLLDDPPGHLLHALREGIAEGLGIDPTEVQSPTFTLVREHTGTGGRLIHLDLYRLTPSDLPSIGLEDWLDDAEAIKIVEWAERLPQNLDADLRLELRRTGKRGQREIREIRGDR